MPGIKTEITEIATGLGMLGFGSLDEALAASSRSSPRPSEMIGVDSVHWDRLQEADRSGAYRQEFFGAWSNGVAFLRADEGLRSRKPLRVEWKGPHRPPGYDLIPADLRIDHVYLVSCKYLSKVLFNASPAHLFDRCLSSRHGGDGADWYLEVAPEAYQQLYAEVRCVLVSELNLPPDVEALVKEHRLRLKEALQGAWPAKLEAAYRSFCQQVGEASAARWRSQLPDKAREEEMLWRLLRLASAPYFILGASGTEVLRLRIFTPWDWTRQFSLRSFNTWGDAAAGQPVVRWQSTVRDKESDSDRTVEGHVEVRWSHGRFRGNPEAKVYLDTPHPRVPGYTVLR